jgi:hypothetical protein
MQMNGLYDVLTKVFWISTRWKNPMKIPSNNAKRNVEVNDPVEKVANQNKVEQREMVKE